MDRMLDAPDRADLVTDEADRPPGRMAWWRSLHASSTRRGLLLTALGGLLIAGLITALPAGEDGRSPIGLSGGTALGARGSDTFDHAKSGDCLNWPERTPDAAQVVDCADEHRFEVSEAIDMRTFPGTEYGPDAAPPSPSRIQQISSEQCQAAARQYLGARYDPNGKFSVSLLWSGDKAWRQSGERRMLCGLQLPGPNNQQLAFRGKVANIDQSKVWSAGTCLGIDPATNQPTDIPVDCAAPHAMEVTGAVNLAEKFPGAAPAEADQDSFVKDECTRMTDAYLAPIQLRSTTLTLIYSTISLPSWTAGSHQVSCSIGATLGNGGWSTLLNSAKGPLLINGQAPVPPPDIPDERLNLPPIPMPTVDTSSQIDLSQQDQSSSSQQDQSSNQGNQHLPGQSTSTGDTGSSTPASPAPPPQGNTFLNGPPPPPGAPQEGPPPPPGDVPPPPPDGGAPAPAPGPVDPAILPPPA
ncbi:septum formation family protein [Mycobacterium sp. URHB0044]|uniref:septum formation family protein n=1 Tax=Mycobacterium sp. URHB0044 TaxID=1380386 RepID=UPI00049082D8|nr:septum formation family protein [Mycobacterium sp. URHB0044]